MSCIRACLYVCRIVSAGRRGINMSLCRFGTVRVSAFCLCASVCVNLWVCVGLCAYAAASVCIVNFCLRVCAGWVGRSGGHHVTCTRPVAKEVLLVWHLLLSQFIISTITTTFISFTFTSTSISISTFTSISQERHARLLPNFTSKYGQSFLSHSPAPVHFRHSHSAKTFTGRTHVIRCWGTEAAPMAQPVVEHCATGTDGRGQTTTR